MTFKALYESCQKLDVPVQIEHIRQQVGALLKPTGRGVAVRYVGFGPETSRGFYLASRNPDTVFYQVPAGAAVIAVSKHQDPNWKRFIEAKELMHVFDDPLDSTNDARELEELLFGLCETRHETKTRQLESEYRCLLMALALFCPEPLRAELQQKRGGSMSDGDMARMLDIPERVVPGLFITRFKDDIQLLVDTLEMPA